MDKCKDLDLGDPFVSSHVSLEGEAYAARRRKGVEAKKLFLQGPNLMHLSESQQYEQTEVMEEEEEEEGGDKKRQDEKTFRAGSLGEAGSREWEYQKTRRRAMQERRNVHVLWKTADQAVWLIALLQEI